MQKIPTNEPHSTAEACANVICDDAAAKHTNIDLNWLVSQQDHPTLEKKEALLKTLQKHSQLFEGLKNKQFGIFPNRDCHIDLHVGAKAHHIKQPHSIPLTQQPAVKTEIKRKVDLGIVEKCCTTEWGMPMFVVPKTDGSCRLIADF